jgi:hypothetical protein
MLSRVMQSVIYVVLFMLSVIYAEWRYAERYLYRVLFMLSVIYAECQLC